jgi:V/A-type H+-transporting ATPase subunit C
MRSRLLGARTYRGLLRCRSVDAVLGALASTDYRADIEAALPRYRDLRRLDEVLRRNLARTLRSMLRFYDKPGPRRCVELLLQRWDLANLRTILRGKARLVAPDEIEPLLVPAGRLDDATLHELARLPGVGVVLDLMVAWSIPSREWAREVWRAFPRYEETRDVAGLERALDAAWARHVVARLAEVGPQRDLELTLRDEIDRRNLLLALRLREARLVEGALVERVAPRERYLAGGRIAPEALDDAAHGPDRATAVERLRTVPPAWTGQLGDWIADGDLVRLTEALDSVATREAVALFHRGDPLGVAVPIAFVWAKENEVRNLRRIGRGLVHGLPRADVAQGLVAAW